MKLILGWRRRFPAWTFLVLTCCLLALSTIAAGQDEPSASSKKQDTTELDASDAKAPPVNGQGKLKVGDPAPKLEIEEWLGLSEGEAPPDLGQNKVVVIEFWATWCAPCIEGIPRLNELADAMGERAQFIAVTSEGDRATVEKFLERKPIHAHVGLDTDESLSRDFNVQVIPHTVIIRPDGRIAAWGHIDDVTHEMLEKVAAGEEIEQLPSFEDGNYITGGEDPFGGVSDGSEMLYVVVRPARGAESMFASSSKGTTAMAQPAKSLVLSAFDARESRCEIRAELPDQRVDFIVRSAVPLSQDDKNSLLRIAIEKNFGIVARREKRKTPVFIVKWTEEARERLTPTVSTGGSGMTAKAGEFSMVGVTVEHLCYSVEHTLGRPVLDETNNGEKFDLRLKWDADQPQSILEAVRTQLGLAVEEAEREVEITVVEKAD
jgi:uncharacterized protein (TIGR03435 family)